METYTGKIYRPWTRSNQRYICTRSRPACWGIGGGILLCFVNIHSYLRKEQRNAILTCVHNVNDETVILLLVEQNVPKIEGQNEVLVYRCTISFTFFPILSKKRQTEMLSPSYTISLHLSHTASFMYSITLYSNF